MILILDRKYGIIFGVEGGEIVREDKLGDLSMELSVEVLQLTKELHAISSFLRMCSCMGAVDRFGLMHRLIH